MGGQFSYLSAYAMSIGTSILTRAVSPTWPREHPKRSGPRDLMLTLGVSSVQSCGARCSKTEMLT